MQNLIGAQMARFLSMLILFAVVWILPATPAGVGRLSAA